MKIYKADIHIHTVLSPCGGLDMSPVNIVSKAREKELDIIGITDHNSTRHCELVRRLAEKEGIFVFTGAEVTTKEEVHCLTFFETTGSLNNFQDYINRHLPYVKNNPAKFGHQVVVDENENILEEIDPLLIMAINQSVEQVKAKVAELDGIFIPAHIDRQRFGLISQLGFVPGELNADAFEVANPQTLHQLFQIYPELMRNNFVTSSDAHRLAQIGSRTTNFKLNGLSFQEIRKALHNIEGREVIIA